MLDVQEIFFRRVLLMSQILMVALSEFLVAPVENIKVSKKYFDHSLHLNAFYYRKDRLTDYITHKQNYEAHKARKNYVPYISL